MSTDLGTCATADCTKLPFLQFVQPGTDITIDDTDLRNPIINSLGGMGGGFNYIDISTTYSA